MELLGLKNFKKTRTFERMRWSFFLSRLEQGRASLVKQVKKG